MSTKVLDKDKVLELLRRYRPGLVVDKAGAGRPLYRFLCPFHNDTNPSFSHSLHTNRGFCYACRNGATTIELLMRFENCSLKHAEALFEACKRFVNNDPTAVRAKNIDVSIAQIQAWQTDLVTDTKLQVLMKKWGWDAPTIEKYMLGSSDGRLAIPMFEQEHLVGLKYYDPGNKTMKYQNTNGSAQCCWPLDNLREDVVYLVEGEKDCLTMLSAGFNAVTFTTGAGGVPKEYIKYFAGKTVYIIYDIDEVGRSGAVTTAKILNYATKNIYIVELPLEGVPKGDLTDAYMEDPSQFVDYINELVANTTKYEAPAAVNRIAIPAEVVKTYLEAIVPKKLFYRRVNMKVRVVGRAQGETVIVPRDVKVSCNKDHKEHLCQQCPLFYVQEGMHLHVKPEYPELMSMVGNNLKVQRAAIQSMVEVIEGCPKFKIEQNTHQALYRVTIIPSIEADKNSHNYELVDAWVLDVTCKDNIDYDVEAVVLANPDTQRRELVCYRMTEDAESIDSFELDEKLMEALKIFQIQEK